MGQWPLVEFLSCLASWIPRVCTVFILHYKIRGRDAEKYSAMRAYEPTYLGSFFAIRMGELNADGLSHIMTFPESPSQALFVNMMLRADSHQKHLLGCSIDIFSPRARALQGKP